MGLQQPSESLDVSADDAILIVLNVAVDQIVQQLRETGISDEDIWDCLQRAANQFASDINSTPAEDRNQRLHPDAA